MRRLCLAVLLLGLASLAQAQTNDHLYRSWRWEEDVASPRAAGLAGAFVALADDASAAALNPAGLAILPKGEVAASLLRRGPGSTSRGDSLAARTGIGFIGGAAPLGSRWAVGAYLDEPRAVSFDLTPFRLPDHTLDQGYLDAYVRNFGASAAYEVTRKLRMGAGLTGTRLELSGVDSRYLVNGPEMLHTKTDSRDTALRGSVGALYALTERVNLGIAARSGAGWHVNRSAFLPESGIMVDPGSSYNVRAPATLAGGATFRPFDRLLLSTQLDYVRYSQIKSRIALLQGRVNPRDYRVDDAFEPRVGAEWSQPVRTLTLTLRGGVYSEGSGSLRYVGPDDVEAVTFLGSSRRLLKAVGASVFTRTGFGMDLATVFGGDRTVFVAGGRYRF